MTTRHLPPVVQQQVHPIPLVADADALLPGHERKARAEFQQKPLQMPDDGFFQIRLAVLVLQVQKLQQIRIANLILQRDRVFRLGMLPPRENHRLTGGMGRSLEKLGADLPIELPHRPPAPDRFCFIEGAGVRLLH